MMHYDVLNLAGGDLTADFDFLQQIRINQKCPFISSNIKKPGNQFWLSYMIKKCQGLNVGFIGVVAPELVNAETIRKNSITIRKPVESLKPVVSKIRGKTDILVLLSHLGWDATVDLLHNVSGIDIAIVGHEYYPDFKPEKIGSTLVLKNNFSGKHLGIINIKKRLNAKGFDIESELRELSDDIHTYVEFTFPESEFERRKRAQRRAEREATKAKQDVGQSRDAFLKELHKLSPEEFMEMVEKNGGRIDFKKNIK